jgi:uncharacterized protein
MPIDKPAQMIVKPAADQIFASVTKAAKKGPPPVHLWNPPYCGEIDIRVARDGLWYYLGTPIGRQPLVDLFASILKLEDGKYYLVTPVEKVGIRVEDAPLFVIDAEAEGQGRAQSLRFFTRTGDAVTAGADHMIRIERDPQDGEPSPYVHIRAGLWARIDRKTFYRLVDLCVHEPLDGASWFGLWSDGQFFPVIPSAELT